MRILPVFVIVLASVLSAADWPQYLGPERTGSVPWSFNPAKWPKGGLPATAWQVCTGNGIASPIVVGGRIYTIGAIKPGADPADGVAIDEMWSEADFATGLPAGSPLQAVLAKAVRNETGETPTKFRFLPVVTHAFCHDAASGRQLWATPISEVEGIYVGEGMNLPRAAPLFHNGRIHVQTHAGAIACLSAADGRVLWRNHIAQLGSQRTYIFGKAGVGGAPFTDGQRIFLTFPVDNNQSSVTAFAPDTGQVLWQRTLNTGFRVDLLSASLAAIEGRPTIVVPGGYRTYGIAPEDGAVLWTFDAHAQWPEISFDKSKHSRDNTVYWEDQHPGRIPVIWNDHIINRVFIWGGHKDQRTYCIKVEQGRPRLIWDRKTLSAWRGLYIRKDGLLLAMDYNHATTSEPPTKNLTREPPVYDEKRYQGIDIPTGKLVWSTDDFTDPKDSRNLSYGHFEPEHIVAGDKVIVMHMRKLGYGTISGTGITIESVSDAADFWGFSPLVLVDGRLYFQRMAAAYRSPRSFGGGTANLFCMDLR